MADSMALLINLAYALAAVLFIVGLKMLGSPATARRGNLISAVAMFIAVVVTLLDRSIVDVRSRPAIQNFRVDLGAAINSAPCPDKLILGADSLLLNNADFVVTQLTPQKPFAFEPFFMQTKFRFIEGYQGNDTVRGWRDYDSIYHAVFACMRGTHGYPKGRAYDTVPQGLLLRPAIPSAEVFGVESTYGPRANFKISLRELPDRGRFRVTVTAAKSDDGLLLDPGDHGSHMVLDRAEVDRRIDGTYPPEAASLRLGCLGRRDHFCLAGVGASVADVVHHGVAEEERILQHDADLLAQAVERHGAHVHTVDRHLPGRHVVEARQQVDQRRLARTRRPDDGDGLSRFGGQVDALEHRLALFVFGAGVVEDDAPLNLRHRRGVAPVSYTHLRAHQTVLDLLFRLLLEKKKHKSSRYRRRSS